MRNMASLPIDIFLANPILGIDATRIGVAFLGHSKRRSF